MLKRTKYQTGRSVQTYDEKERAGVQRAIDAEKRKSRYSVSKERLLDNRMYIMDEDAISLAKQSIDKVVENERSRKVRLKLKQQEASAAVAAPIGEDDHDTTAKSSESNSKAVDEKQETNDAVVKPNPDDDPPPSKADARRSAELKEERSDRLRDDMHTSSSRQTFQFRKANFPEKGSRGETVLTTHPEPRAVGSNTAVERLHKLAGDGRQLPLDTLKALDLPSLTPSDLSRVLWCVVKTNSASWAGFSELLRLLAGEVDKLSPKEVARTLLGATQVRTRSSDTLLTHLVGALLSRAAIQDTVGTREALTGSSACVALCAVSKLIINADRHHPSGWLADLHDTVESLAGRLIVGSSQASGEGLSNKEICVALSGMANSGVLHRPSVAVMLDQLLGRSDTLLPTQVVGILWSLSKLQVRLSGDVMKNKIRPALGELAQLPPREVASLLYSTGRCTKDKGACGELRKELMQYVKPQHLNGNEISAVIEGLASVDDHTSLLDDEESIIIMTLDRLSEIRHTLSPSQMVRCSIALHKLPRTDAVTEVSRSLLGLCEERLYAFKPHQYVALLPTGVDPMVDRSSRSIYTKAREQASSLSVPDLIKLLALAPDDAVLLRAIDGKVTDEYRFPRPAGAVVAARYLELLGRDRGQVIRRQVPNLVRMSRTTQELHRLLYAVGVLSNADTIDHLHTKYGVQALQTAVSRVGVEEDPVTLLEALSYVRMDPSSTTAAIMATIEERWSQIEAADKDRALAATAELGIDPSSLPVPTSMTLPGLWSRMVREPDPRACPVGVLESLRPAGVDSPVDAHRLQQLYLHHLGSRYNATAAATTKGSSSKYSRWISDALSYLGIPHQPDSPQLGGACVILARLPTHGIGMVMDESTYPGDRPTGRSLVQRRQLLNPSTDQEQQQQEGITRLVMVRRLDLVRARQKKELVPFTARLLTGFITDSTLLQQYSTITEPPQSEVGH
ncbi:hypothetical protein FOZ60_012422 [Perkinsus olseni]|uniref:Uncharacterized protein n=1 Tax=Perkinsus olseni TaxID=32597 RepID=A0A7J6NBP4_PEROL|nr:hypothetical protein FOZ60_012422 [Perkinsus olseni]